MAAPVKIGSRYIGDAYPPFVVLEAGINHNGELSNAIALIELAKQCKADAVKFQTFKAVEFVGDPSLTFTYRSSGQTITESMRAMFERMELSRADWKAIRKACDDAGIIFMSTPQNASDLELLLEIGLPAVKIGSDDFNNLPLLATYAAKGLPLILSCGMADMDEVRRSLEVVRGSGDPPVVLLVCTSQYPTPAKDANLLRISTLKDAFPELVVGFSDHTQGVQAAIVAAALGASVFEKHFTLDRNLPGPDHWFSADPAESATWVEAIRSTPAYLGDGRIAPTIEEMKMRALTRRSVTALRPIAAGETLSADNVGLRRPGTGLPPERLESVLGRSAARDIPALSMISDADVK